VPNPYIISEDEAPKQSQVSYDYVPDNNPYKEWNGPEMFFKENGDLKDEGEKGDPLDTDLGELDSEVVNERYMEFKVSKPTQRGGVTWYEVVGYNKEESCN